MRREQRSFRQDYRAPVVSTTNKMKDNGCKQSFLNGSQETKKIGARTKRVDR
jgi:hypothetical protein